MGYDFRDYLKDERPYLTSDEIKALIYDGFAFGSHSIDHPEYRLISEEEQIRQTKDSLDELCKRFGLDYRFFSFPFTDEGVTRQFFQRIFDPRDPVADITFGEAGMKKDTFPDHFQRIPFEGTSLPAKQLLAGEYAWWMLKSLAGRNGIKRS